MPRLCCWSGGNLSICYRQRARQFLGLVYVAFDPGTLCFQWKCHTGCLSRAVLRNRFGRRARRIKASLTSTSTLCNAQCHSSHRSQLESSQKNCPQRSLPCCAESEGWKVLPDRMHSSPKLQYRKKHLPLTSCWILIWHIPKFSPTKGHSVTVPIGMLQASIALLTETFCSF